MIAIAAPTAPAQQQAWGCDAFGYLFQTQANAASSDIIQVDLATGVQNPVGVVGTPPPGGAAVVNAVAYNSVDNYFYASMATYPVLGGAFTTSVVRIHPDGSVDDLGVPTGPGGTVDPSVGYHTGDIDPSGHYWMSNGAIWYEIDLTTPAPTVVDSGAVTTDPPAGSVADWAWTNGALHSIASAGVGVPARLVRFNPATGVLEDLGPVGFNDGGIGAVFVDAAGYLYASQNATNDIYRIDTTTRQTILASEGTGTSPGNDGARCALAPVPTITVTKTVAGRVRAADQFTVGLRRPDGSLADSATTSGAGTTASTVNFPASQGQTYTITDAMGAGSPTPLGEYAKSLACTDANGSAVAVGGTGPTWTMNVAAATAYTCNVTNQAVADLRMEKSAAPSPVVPGRDVTWTMTVTNDGPSTSIGETVIDQLPAEVTFSSASAGCSEATGTVTCAVGALAPGASKTFTITARVASSLDECLENSATVSGQFDPDPSNNTSTICTPIRGESDLRITKDPSSATVAAGGQVMYTLVIRNTGPSDDPNVTVSDPLAPGLTLVSARASQGSCTTTNNVVSCDLGGLADGGSAQVLVTANVPTTAGCITNTARVQGAHDDPTPGNNQDSAEICVEPPIDPVFDLAVTKTANDRDVFIGQPVRYRVVVRNNGPDAAPAVTLKDTISAPVSVVSVRTTQGSCTKRIPMTCELGAIEGGASATITIVAKHRESGCRQRQAASATGDGTDTNPADNMDTVNVCVRIVRLKLSKVASRSQVQGGETFSYRIRVRNPTKGEARNVKVCDRLPSGLQFVSSKPRSTRQGGQRCWTIKRLGAGKSRTFTVTVRAANGAFGRKTNTATVTSPDAARVRARHRVQVSPLADRPTG